MSEHEELLDDEEAALSKALEGWSRTIGIAEEFAGQLASLSQQRDEALLAKVEANHKIEALSEEVAELTDSIRLEIEERDKTLAHVKHFRAINARLTESLADALTKAHDLETRVGRLTREREETPELQDLQAQVAGLTKERDDARELFVMARDRLEEAKAKIPPNPRSRHGALDIRWTPGSTEEEMYETASRICALLGLEIVRFDFPDTRGTIKACSVGPVYRRSL